MHEQRRRVTLAALALACAALAAFTPTPRAGAEDKLKPEEVVAKHLEAIGPAEARSPQRPRVAQGATLMEAKAGGRGISEGRGLIASTGDKVLLNATFESPDYPFERIGFDGERVSARPIRPNVRSPLSHFFLAHETVFKEGLIGGALSTAWPLLHLEERKAKLSYSGKGEAAGRPAHKLRYAPRKGSDLKVTLFFDAENFRHLRTEYERTVPAPIGATPNQSVSQRETRYRLVEDFSDFKTEDGLTLPRSYTVGLTIFSTGAPMDITWKFNLTRVHLDQPIDPKVFVTDTN
ncbi:MAG TPA: hypothetical protein VN282_00970 [Pyrinomonadaceae bacterium]|nr:hypothetical protein [Pyrinomonadaceae bacterium]